MEDELALPTLVRSFIHSFIYSLTHWPGAEERVGRGQGVLLRRFLFSTAACGQDALSFSGRVAATTNVFATSFISIVVVLERLMVLAAH